MSDQVHICENLEALSLHARQWLVDLIARQRLESPGNKFTLALAGGSTPRALYELLSQLPEGTVDWSQVVLIWGDERNVPPDHADSNFGMVKEALLDHIDIPPENVLAVPDPGGKAATAAESYEALLREAVPARGRKFPRFDCVLLGLGNDVHTASLFPHTEALAEKSRLVVANHVPKLDSDRITLTAPLLNAARYVAFLLSGESKSEALSLLWHAPHDTELYPAKLIRPTSGSLVFMVDKAAMGTVPLPESAMAQLI
jgi:6-phosphogluconolactonase